MRYQSIHQVPKRWRTIQGTPLSLAQIEAIVTAAEGGEQPFAVAFGEAKRRFVQRHSVVDGQWVKTGGKH